MVKNTQLKMRKYEWTSDKFRGLLSTFMIAALRFINEFFSVTQ